MEKRSLSPGEIPWSKLDNTAHLFPVIATERMTNVYRLSVTLQEKIEPLPLQQALDMVLPWFDSMNVRMRTGAFWYYFEKNPRPAPLVAEENTYPCGMMIPRTNRQYLFRVSYYKNRINLEVFHVLADGMGGNAFLTELVCQYLRLVHPDTCGKEGNHLSVDVSLDTEDSYLKNFRRGQPRGYKSDPAYHMKGDKLKNGAMGVIHGYLSLQEIKETARRKGFTINEYLAGILVYSIYREYLHCGVAKKPIVLCVPVNLRPYFDSLTNRNFFAMVSALFRPDHEDYTLEEVEEIVAQSLRGQIQKENLEKLFSYNVSNQKNLMLRAVPLVIKKMVMQWVYHVSAGATTTTLTNVGGWKVKEVYAPYIKSYSAVLSPSRGQHTKATVTSCGEELVVTFSTILKDVSLQKRFFRILAADGIGVTVESNLHEK